MHILRPCLIAALLAGCGPEYGLNEAPGGDGTGSDGTPPVPGTGDPPDGGDGRDNPWGRLTPDEIPEFYFAVAWVDPAAEAPYSCWGEELRYAIIDLRGHVIAEYEPPAPEAADGLWQGYAQHRRLLPAGPGQFVAVTGNDYYYDADDCYGYGSTDWYAWRGDGLTREASPVASGLWTDAGYATRLHAAERDIVHGNYGYTTTVAMQPDAPTDLMLWYADWTCEGVPGALTAVDVEDAAVEDVTYAVTELLPGQVLGVDRHVAPFVAHANVDAEHRMGMLFGSETRDCAGIEPMERWISAWTEDQGHTWHHRVDDLAWPYDVEYSALDGGAALYLPAATEEGQPYRLLSADGVAEGWLPEVAAVNPRAGALLDPAGPSLLITAQREDGTGDALVVVHDERAVWTIDELSFGLARRPVWIRDVMLIPPVAEE